MSYQNIQDMTEAKKAGRQMQRNSDTRTSSHNYLKAGRKKFRRSNLKPYDRTSTGQKTAHSRPLLRVQPGTKECPGKAQPIQPQRLIDNQVRTHFTSFMDEDYLHQLVLIFSAGQLKGHVGSRESLTNDQVIVIAIKHYHIEFEANTLFSLTHQNKSTSHPVKEG